MPRPYSTDLRERVLMAYENGEGSQAAVAGRFRIGERTLSGWLKAAREEGRRGPEPRTRGPAPLGGKGVGCWRHWWRSRTTPRWPSMPIGWPGARASGAAPCRRVPGAQGAGPCAEEKTLRAAEQDRADIVEERAAWRAGPARIEPDRLIFIDETPGSTPAWRAPTHARAARGQRAPGKVPYGHWQRLTVIGALAQDGVIASMSITAATSTAVFLAFVEQALMPALRDRPGSVVVMDNLAAHKAKMVRAALDRAGLSHRHRPLYSPDLNPIEQAWSKLKARLRAEGIRSREALEIALGPALVTITAQDARGWFRLCGYNPAN